MSPAKKPDWNSLIATAADAIKERSRHPNIRKYKPHEKQAIFHKSHKKRILYIGGNRSGKSVGGVCEGIWRATGKHPFRPDLNVVVPTRGRVVTVDFVQGLDKIILPLYKQWTPPEELLGGVWEQAYDKHLRQLTFANGSTIEFMSYDQDLDKFAGTSRHWIHFDEEPPRSIFVECLARLVDTDGDFWITMTPVEGMTWVYDDLYEGQVNNPDSDVEVIEINSFENPYLPKAGIEGLLKMTKGDDASVRVSGNFVTVGGKIYPNFDKVVGSSHVLSQPILNPAEVFDDRLFMWALALDHGLNNPTAALWLAVDSNGFVIQFDEYYQAGLTIEQNAANINKKIAEHGRTPELMVADPSIQNRSPITMTSIQEEYQRYGLSFILGNNDVKAGIVRVKKYLTPGPYVSTLRSRPEVFGGPAPGQAIENFILAPKWLNFPRYTVTPNCVKTIWEFDRYRWKTYTNKKLQFERNPYEEPNKKDDHAMDALRYFIMTQPDLRAENKNLDSEHIDRVMDQLSQKLASTATDYDDPRELIGGPDRNWNPEVNSMPNETNWEFDEHMGGIM